MCGINGLVYKNAENTDVQRIIEKMNQKIIHRGPDEDGFFVEHLEDKTIAFAMRRLSIVDLSTGKQPIFTEDKSKVIVFNGQIYNSEELKKTLHFSPLEEEDFHLPIFKQNSTVIGIHEGEIRSSRLQVSFRRSNNSSHRGRLFTHSYFTSKCHLHFAQL